MNKTLLFRTLSTSILLLFLLLFNACENKLGYEDYSYKTSITSESSSKVNFTNMPIPLKLSMIGDNISKEEFIIRLSDKSQFEGFLIVNNLPLTKGAYVKHTFDLPLTMTFTPITSGVNKLVFTLESEFSGINEVELPLDILKPAFNLSFREKPDSVLLNNPTEMLISVTEDLEALKKIAETRGTKAAGGAYTLRAEIKKGSGILTIGDKVLFTDTETKTKSTANDIELASNSEVKMVFSSSSIGENIISYTLSDSYDNSVKSTETFESITPNWTIVNTFRSDSIYATAQAHKFVLSIDNKNPEIPNEYKLSVTNSEDFFTKIFVNGTYVPNNSEVSIKNSNEIQFSNPQFTNLSNVKLTVTDKFGSSDNFILSAKFQLKGIDYKFTDFPIIMKSYLPYNFTGNLNIATTSETKYKLSYTTDIRKVRLYCNDVLVENGKPMEISAGNHNYRVVADTVGTFNIPIIISDSYNQKFTHSLKFNVAENPIAAKLSPLVKIVYGNSQTATITIPSDLTHISSFTARMITETGYSSSVEINGQKISGETPFPLKTGTNTIKFTPNVVLPKYISKISIEASTGQIVDLPVEFEIELPKLTTSLETVRAVSNMIDPLLYNITVEEPFYDNSFTIQKSILTGDGVVKIGDRTLNNDPNELGKKGVYNISILPTSINPLSCQLRIVDKNGQISLITLTGTVANTEATFKDNLASKDLKYLTPVAFSITISQPTQQVPYQFFNILNSAVVKGVIKINDKAYIWQSSRTDITPTSYNLEFTPSSIGDNTLTFQVTDKDTKDHTHTIPFVVTPYPLITSIVNQSSASVNRATPVTFDLNVSEEKLVSPTKFKYTYKPTTGDGILSVDGVPLTANMQYEIDPGKASMAYTPMTPGDNTVDIEVSDIFGQKTTKTAAVKAVNNPVTASVTPTAEVYITNPASLTFTVDEPHYTGAYKVKYSNTGGTGVFQNKGVVITSGGTTTVTKGNTAFTYTPSTKGTHTLNFIVSDDFGQQKTIQSVITVNQSLIVASPSVSTTNTTVNSPASFTINVSAAGYSGKFYTSYTGGTGALSVNGGNLAAGATKEIPSGASSITFTPSTVGTHTLNFTVSDDYSKTKTFAAQVVAGHLPMTFNSVFVTNSTYLSRPVNVAITASGGTPFNVKYSGGNGTLVRNSSTISQNSNVTISSNETWQYTPSTTGTHTLSFTATDRNGQSMTQSTTLSSLASTITTSLAQTSHTVIYNKATSNNILFLSNTAGDTPLKVTWSSSKSGSVNIVSGNTYAAGKLSNIQYTPSEVGTHTIIFTVSDSYGQSANTTWTVNAIYADLVLTVPSFTSLTTSCPLGRTYGYAFRVSKEAYPQNIFNVTIRTDGKGVTGTIDKSLLTIGAGEHYIYHTSPKESALSSDRLYGDNTCWIEVTVTDLQGGSITKGFGFGIGGPRAGWDYEDTTDPDPDDNLGGGGLPPLKP